MGAMAAIGVGFLLGAWAAVLGLRLPFAWMACVVVLAAGLLVAVSTTSAAVQPGARGRWIFFALALLTGQAVAPARSIQTEVPSGVARVEGVVERVVADQLVDRIVAHVKAIRIGDPTASDLTRRAAFSMIPIS